MAIGNKKDETIVGSYALEAKDIKQIAENDMKLVARSKMEHLGTKSMKIDGGDDLEIAGNKIKNN